jgi:hypothetical protein
MKMLKKMKMKMKKRKNENAKKNENENRAKKSEPHTRLVSAASMTSIILICFPKAENRIRQ